MSVPCSNVLWPQRPPWSSPSSPWRLPPLLFSPLLTLPSNLRLQCGPWVCWVLSCLTAFCSCGSLCLGHSFPDDHMGHFLISFRSLIKYQMSERPTWRPNLKLRHLHKAATSLVSFPNLFFFQVIISIWNIICFMYLLFSAPLPSPKKICTLHKGRDFFLFDSWNLST